jgi:hypothetical protein
MSKGVKASAEGVQKKIEMLLWHAAISNPEPTKCENGSLHCSRTKCLSDLC